MYIVMSRVANILLRNITRIKLDRRTTVRYNEEGRRSIRQTGDVSRKRSESEAVDSASRHQFSRKPASV